MEQMFEFVGNHPYLWMALVVVLVLLVKAEFESRTNQSVHLNPMSAIRLINNSDDALIIDVRENSDFSKGHIKGATNLPLSVFKEKLDSIAAKKESVVLAYCTSGASSTRACRLLNQAGFTNVHNIAGGMNAWLDAKLPTTKK